MEYPTYLIHYGVPGQKWGVRRWQNEDGTWTEEGKEHRRVNASELPSFGGEGISRPLRSAGYDEVTEKIGENANKDFVIKKGTIYKRVTTNKKEKFKERTYVSGSSEQYAEWLVDSKKDYYIDELKTKRDVIIAGEDTVKDILKSIGNENANKVLKAMTINSYDDNFEDTQFFPEGAKRSIPYTDFLNADHLKIKHPFIKELKKRGYDGLLDPLDGMYYSGLNLDIDATIFVNNVLKKEKQTKYKMV